MTVLKMTDLDLAGKRVLIREDLNVPVKEGVVKSDARIVASLPTIKLALEKGAAVMVCSHLGRPTEGEYSEENSLAPVAAYLSKALAREVPLVKDYLGGVEVKPGEVEIGHLQNGHGQSFTGAGYLEELATARKCSATSSIRLAKPHSLSNQASRLTRRGPETRVWLPSTMAEWASWLKSQLACGSSV